jgi:hypothetical protein
MVETLFWKASDKTHPDWRYFTDILCVILVHVILC